MKKIYLVIENGAGTIHRAFNEMQKAEEMIEQLKKQTDMDCYEIMEIVLE